MLAAQVAVNNATFHFDKLYSYMVPPALAQTIAVGSMVLVPFGRGSTKARMGVVLQLDDIAETNPKLKYIYDVAPEKARLSPDLLELVYFLKERTFCTYYEAVKAIIPYGAQYKAVNENGAPCLQKQLVRHTYRSYRVHLPLNMAMKYSPKQKTVIQYLGEEAAAEQAILESCGITKAVLDTMCKKEILHVTQEDMEPEQQPDMQPAAPILLSKQQQTVFEELLAYMQKPQPHAALLHGVTASGKTLVFIKLMQQALAQNKTALVLVPEISLTPQMIRRLRSVFGKRVAVQHSALNNTQRLLQWQQIQNGEADIVVGTRSAVFAPLQNIGIIIIDEEQEHTYASEQAPRYLAHDVAKKRAVNNQALLLLASATPSVESYYNAQEGRYSLHTLTERYGARPMPQVEMVDMRQELAKGNTGSISTRLADEIAQNLTGGKQTILLLNRRGYKTLGMCGACGEVLQCDHCSVPMVYHKQHNKLMCHYCGHTIEPIPQQCPKCGGKMRYNGFGTQRAEEELEQMFPQARILRMDMDTTTRKNAHEEMLSDFEKGNYDILIGTQMVAKGLDFERVTLVGVLGIDQLLYSQSYRATENVFSLVTQVVGRGGRGSEPGRALIQTVDPDNSVLNLAAKQDYLDFYNEVIGFRKINLYPPYCSICAVCFTASKEKDARDAAQTFAGLLRAQAALRQGLPLRILGPAPFHIVMINNRYRYKLTVKCRNDKPFRSLVSEVMAQFIDTPQAGRTSMYLDFNTELD